MYSSFGFFAKMKLKLCEYVYRESQEEFTWNGFMGNLFWFFSWLPGVCMMQTAASIESQPSQHWGSSIEARGDNKSDERRWVVFRFISSRVFEELMFSACS